MLGRMPCSICAFENVECILIPKHPGGKTFWIDSPIVEAVLCSKGLILLGRKSTRSNPAQLRRTSAARPTHGISGENQ